MAYERVANQAELPPTKMKIVVVNGKEILLANVYGMYYAIANKCTHSGGSLGQGSLDGTCVRCPNHGAMFDLRTGKAVEGAKIGFMKIKVKDETCYPVKIEGTDILVGFEEILTKEF